MGDRVAQRRWAYTWISASTAAAHCTPIAALPENHSVGRDRGGGSKYLDSERVCKLCCSVAMVGRGRVWWCWQSWSSDGVCGDR